MVAPAVVAVAPAVLSAVPAVLVGLTIAVQAVVSVGALAVALTVPPSASPALVYAFGT